MSHWKDLTSHFLDQTEELLTHMIAQRLDDVFGMYKSTKLYESISKTCDSLVQKAMAQQRSASERNRELEVFSPMTFNEEAYKQASDKAKDTLQERRRRNRADVFLQGSGSLSGIAFTQQAWDEKLSKVTDSQLGEDPYKQEIETMSVCRVNTL